MYSLLSKVSLYKNNLKKKKILSQNETVHEVCHEEKNLWLPMWGEKRC